MYFAPPIVIFLASSAVLGIARTQDVNQTNTKSFDPCEQAWTRHFDLTISWALNAPDGIERNMFMVNGQFPGPKIELTQGDSVVVKLKNASPFNTSIHFHGTYPNLDSSSHRETIIWLTTTRH